MKKVRLKNIAEPLGVSIASVHRALNNISGVNAATRELILEKARELGHEVESDLHSHKQHTKTATKMKISVLCPYDIYFETVINGMRSAKEQLGYQNIDLEFRFEEVYDVVVQSEHLREIVRENNVDGIAIAPAHPLMLNPLINELADKGKIVVTFNTDAPSSKRLCYIGQNAVIAGKMAAEILGMKLGETGEIAVLKSFSATSGVVEREKGFAEYINQYYPDIKILGPFEYFDSVDEAMRIAVQVILSNPGIRGLFANNMMGTLGCARAVVKTDCGGKIFVAGYDNNEEMNDFIKKGIITVSVLQDPYYQGYLTIRTIARFLMGNKKVSKEFLYTQCNLLMKSSSEIFTEDKVLK